MTENISAKWVETRENIGRWSLSLYGLRTKIRLKIVGCGKKNRERTKTNNCALASRNSSSDHVPSSRPPITVYILPDLQKIWTTKILSFHIQLHFIFGVQLEITSSLSLRSGIVERQKDVSVRERRHPRSVFPLAPRLLARSSRFACDARVACSSIVLFSNKNAKRAQKANKQTKREANRKRNKAK